MAESRQILTGNWSWGCAVRVTVPGLCVCLFVCYHDNSRAVPSQTRITYYNIVNLTHFLDLRISQKKALFKRYGVICLPWLGLTFSVDRIPNKNP